MLTDFAFPVSIFFKKATNRKVWVKCGDRYVAVLKSNLRYSAEYAKQIRGFIISDRPDCIGVDGIEA